QGVYSIHEFVWGADAITFSSRQGQSPGSGEVIATWAYEGADLPPAGQTQIRINLWLQNGTPPSDGQSLEVVITSFSFVPAS
ncbi:MAG: serine protease, partial [Thermotogaceae bacterium]|nr:serine protease [Thermotogaceae bacterium]